VGQKLAFSFLEAAAGEAWAVFRRPSLRTAPQGRLTAGGAIHCAAGSVHSSTRQWGSMRGCEIGQSLNYTYKINLIKELLCVKFHKGQISLFSESDVDFMIWFLCTS